MSIIFEELLNSSPFAIIELYELETFAKIHGAANSYYFFAGHNKEDTPAEIVFNNHTYLALPIEADGFEYKGDGGLPRPSVRIANLQGNISAILLGINEFNFGNDLIGARFTRVRTLSRFLDGSNWQSGTNPYGTPNPGETMPNEIYYVDRKVSENRDFVEFELVSSFDMAGVRAPKRQALSNLCQWEYKSKECGYTGSDKFNEDDTVITTAAAPGYTYTSGADVLSSGVFLQENEELVSSNGWFRLSLGSDGNLSIFQKPPTNETVIWSTNTVDSPGGGGNYQLRMATNGNLPIDRNDNIGEFIWNPGLKKIGDVKTGTSGVTFQNWTPLDVYGGRPGAFGYEIVVIDGGGSTPTAAGQTSSAYSVTFTENGHQGYGAGSQNRTVTISFTFTSGALSATHYSGQSFSWNSIASASVTGSTGLWQDGETFVAGVDISSSNPFRNNPNGTLSTVGAAYAITSDNWDGVYQLKLRTDGRIQIQNSAGNRVIWRSSNGAVTTEPTVDVATAAPDQDVCGKRLSSCRKRFPTGKDDHGGLPFGSFPGVGTVR
jgi:lambda family phage minor tail protein L